MKRLIVAIAIFALCLSLMTAPAQAQPRANWPKGATIGTSGIGGVYFVWGGGFAKLLNDKVGVPANVEVTAGSVANVKLIQVGKLDFGQATSAPIYEGWVGEGWAKGEKYQNVRVIFPMFTSYAHAYAPKKTGIKEVKDLSGKAVGVGAVGNDAGRLLVLGLQCGGGKTRTRDQCGVVGPCLPDEGLDDRCRRHHQRAAVGQPGRDGGHA